MCILIACSLHGKHKTCHITHTTLYRGSRHFWDCLDASPAWSTGHLSFRSFSCSRLLVAKN
uniref:Uncharacterized protein n=1 Tax=Anguilla anguilla TaxID=7936 RepID=A0A0E9SV53_ANGAN